jgi:autotransporter-associated beta strand protein
VHRHFARRPVDRLPHPHIDHRRTAAPAATAASWRRGACTLLAFAGIGLSAAAAQTTDGQWTGSSGSEWTDPTNWTSNPVVPDGTATFPNAGSVSTTSVTNTGLVNIGTVAFNADAAAYTFAIQEFFLVNGSGIINNSTINTQTFDNTGSTAALIFQNASSASGGPGMVSMTNGFQTTFQNTSTAGSATITNNGALEFNDASSAGSSTITNTATTNFFGTSTAGSANITNTASGTLAFGNDASAGSAVIGNAGTLDFTGGGTAGNAQITNTGLTEFFNSASGGNATITNDAAGTLTFNDTSTAGDAGITNAGTLSFNNTGTAGNAAIGNSGTVGFFNSADAGSATIANAAAGTIAFNDSSSAFTATINNAGTLNFLTTSTASGATIGNTASLGFFNSAGAGSAAITNAAAGTVTFNDSSSATDATIDNAGTLNFLNTSTASAASISNSATIGFLNSADAGSATIGNAAAGTITFNNSSSASGAAITNAGSLVFTDTSIAATATITTTSGGTTQFLLSTSGDTARFITNAGGTVDFSALTGAGTTAGSIEGGGSYVLGAKALTVGSNNLSTEVSGVISGVGGSLVKTGTGTLTLSGINTYTGGTTINDGTLQIGNGGSSGSILGNVVTNATLAFNRSDTLVFGTDISGTGMLDQRGPGTTVLTGNATHTGGTTISAGTLQIGNGGTAGTLTGNVVDNGTLAFNRSDTLTFSGDISGTGMLDQRGAGTSVLTGNASYTGGTTISAGTLQIGNGGTSGTISGAITDNATLAFNRSDTVVFSGTVSGSGALNQIGTGTLILTGNNSYTGGTSIVAGTLQIGNGGTSGSILGNVLNDGLLAINRSDAMSLAGVISGTGGVAQIGSGTTTLTNTNSYTGATSVDAGTLLVTGSIASSSATVNAGGILGGTGILGTTVINGGTLSPGTSIGTITIAGNLTFVGPGTYLVEVSPASADRTNVSGTASLDGTLRAVGTGGRYVLGQQYTVLTSTGGVSGTFALDVTGDFGVVQPRLVQDLNTVYLVLDARALAPLLPPGTGSNQRSVADVIDSIIAAGQAPVDFGALFNVPSGGLPAALSQLTGEIGTGGPRAGLLAMSQFLGVMLDPFADNRTGLSPGAGAAPLGFAPERAALPEAVSAFAAVDKAPRPDDRRWTAWGAVFGGRTTASGDAATGSHFADAHTGNVAGGFHVRLSPDAVLGFALAGGSATFGLSDGLGSGNGNIYQAGFYGTARFGEVYVAAAAALSRVDLTTDRIVALPGVANRLTADFAAHGLGGRIEAGRHFALGVGDVVVTPYAALQGQSFRTPSYGERVASGSTAFALNYDAQTTTRARSELGAGIDGRVAGGAGYRLSLFGRAAWAHEFSRDASLAAAFQAVPALGFTVDGARPAADAALITAGSELGFANGVSLRARFDGLIASGASTYVGTGTFRIAW